MVEPGSEGDVTAEEKPHEVVRASVTSPENTSETIEESAATLKSSTSKGGLRFAVILIVVLLGALGYFLISHRNSSSGDLTKIQGNIALSEEELRSVISANHLTVYWAGPVAGDKYTLLATNPNQIYVKYLPGGVGANDKATAYRVIGTYVKKNAFQVCQYTGSLFGNAGLVNGDGNSVFYAAGRTTNVYLGIKGKDIQIEVYDPVAGQALGLVLIKGQIRQIS